MIVSRQNTNNTKIKNGGFYYENFIKKSVCDVKLQ